MGKLAGIHESLKEQKNKAAEAQSSTEELEHPGVGQQNSDVCNELERIIDEIIGQIQPLVEVSTDIEKTANYMYLPERITHLPLPERVTEGGRVTRKIDKSAQKFEEEEERVDESATPDELLKQKCSGLTSKKSYL